VNDLAVGSKQSSICGIEERGEVDIETLQSTMEQRSVSQPRLESSWNVYEYLISMTRESKLTRKVSNA